MTEQKQHLLAGAGKLDEPIVALSRRIHGCPELSHRESQAVAACRELLGRHGFAVEAVAGVETAFVATRRGARPGPTVGFLAECDALPGVGHAGGHNLIAGSAGVHDDGVRPSRPRAGR